MNKFTINNKEKINSALIKIKKNNSKGLIVLDKHKVVCGYISDGDIRNVLIKKKKLSIPLSKIYNKNPITLNLSKFSFKICENIIKKKSIDLLPLVDNNNKLINIYSSKFGLIKKNYTNSKIPVVIMAGGLGTRMKPFTNILPKPLIPIGEETITEKIIKNFMSQGFKKFFLIINYKSQIIKNYFENNKLKKNIVFIEEKKRLGTAGGLSLIKKYIKSNRFILTNCDNFIDTNFSDILTEHQINKFEITMLVSETKNVVPYGVCTINTKNELVKIDEKPSQNIIINVGSYVINQKIIDKLNSSYLDMNILIENTLRKKISVGTYKITPKQWFDVGQWNEFEKIKL